MNPALVSSTVSSVQKCGLICWVDKQPLLDACGHCVCQKFSVINQHTCANKAARFHRTI